MGYRGAKLTGWFETDHSKRASYRLAERAGEVMVGVTREHTPVDTGELRGSITEKPVIVRGDRYESGAETEVEYAPFIEDGWGLWGPRNAPYEIRPKKPGGVLSWMDPFTGKRIFAKSVLHPGAPGAHMFATGVALTEGTLRRWAEPILTVWAREQGQNRTHVVYGRG